MLYGPYLIGNGEKMLYGRILHQTPTTIVWMAASISRYRDRDGAWQPIDWSAYVGMAPNVAADWDLDTVDRLLKAGVYQVVQWGSKLQSEVTAREYFPEGTDGVPWRA